MPDIKALYRDATNIGAFIKEYGYGVGHTFFMTITFKSNFDKLACASSFNVFRTFLNKPSVRYSHGLSDADFHYIAVWEQHKKGGWHMHILGHIDGASTKKLRSLIRHFLSVTSTSVGFINIKWTYGHDMHGVRLYMTKYLFKDKRRIRKCRYINYSRNWFRSCCLPFAWVGGLSFQWRKACQELFLNLPHSFKIFYHNSSFRLRQSVISFWVSGHFDSAISLISESFKMGGFSSLLFDDLHRLKCFSSEIGDFIFDSNDSALADFFSFSVPAVNERYSNITLSDSDCIPFRG